MADDTPNGLASDTALPVEGQTASTTTAETEVKADEQTGTDETGTREDADLDGDDTGEKRKPRSGSSRLQRQIAALKAENEALRARPELDDKEAIERAVAREVGDPPKDTDYPDYAAYERAMTAYELDRRQVTREVRKQIDGSKTTVDQYRSEVEQLFQERIDSTIASVPDYRDVVSKSKAQIASHVSDIIKEADKPGEIVYYLAKNPAKADELNAMTPLQAARALGAIESRLSVPSSKATQAQAPITPVKGSPGAGELTQEQRLDRWLKKSYG